MTAPAQVTTFVVLADGATYRNDRGCFTTRDAAEGIAALVRRKRCPVRRGSSITRREYRRVEIVEVRTAAFRPAVYNMTPSELADLAAAWGAK